MFAAFNIALKYINHDVLKIQKESYKTTIMAEDKIK